MAGKNFKYRGYGSDDVKKATTASSGDYDSYFKKGLPLFKASAGENNIRILPRTWDDTKSWGKFWAIEAFVHYSIGAENSAYLCLDQGPDPKDCPICTAAREAEDEDEAKKLKRKKRAVVWLIDRDKEKLGPQLWAMPITLFKEINVRVEKASKDGDIKIDHPEEGYDVSFNKEGEKDRTNYTAVDIARNPSPLSDNDKKAQKWLDVIDTTPIPDTLVFYDEEHVEKVLTGGLKSKSKKRDDDDEDDDDEDDRKDERAARANKKRVSSKDDDDEEEELDTEDEDDEDEDEKPKKGKNKKSSKKSSKDDDDEDDEDEDNEDDDDEDDEADEKPRKGKGKGRDEDDEDDDDEGDGDDEDDEDEDEKPHKGKVKDKKKSSKESSKDDDDEDDDEDDEDEDDDEEEDDSDEDDKGKGGRASQRAKDRLRKLKERRGGR